MKEIKAHELLQTRHCRVVDCPVVDDVDPETELCPAHARDPRTLSEKLGLDVSTQGPPRRARRGPPREKSNELVARELEVLELAAGGANSAEMAQRLTVSQHTVISHRKHLLAKLGAKSMPQAVAIAIRKGVIT